MIAAHRTTRLAAAAALSAVIMAGMTGCHKKEEAPQARPPSPVQVSTAQKATVLVMANSFGRMRAMNDVNINAQVSGKIIEAPFVEGSLVEKGDVLFRIEPDAYQSAVDQAAAQLDGAKADLTQKQATLKRNKQLLEQALVSQEDYDQLETAVDAAKAKFAQARAALDKAIIDLNYCTIVSPVGGMAGKRLVDIGNIVSGAGNQPLVNIRTMDPMYLDFSLSESYFPSVRKAIAEGPVNVLVISESNAGEPGLFQGLLKALDNTVDTASGTISMRAVVDNPQGKLWPGQFVYAYPILGTLSNAIIVPQSAVTQSKAGPFAYVVSNNTTVMRLVEKGPVFGDAIVALSGLQEGDVVVTSGQLALWPGAAVQIKPEADSETKVLLQKRAANPNVQMLVRILAAKGETPEQIGVLIGLPPDVVKKIAPPSILPPATSVEENVRKMSEGGMNIEEIASVIGESEDTVRGMLAPPPEPATTPAP